MNFLCIYLDKEGGVALIHAYVLEHIVSLCYRTARWMFTKLVRDEVLMALHLCLDFGKPRPGVDPGRGKNRSMRGLFSKGLLLQIGRLQRHSECIAVISKHVERKVNILGSMPKSNFWWFFDVFLDLIILV